MLERATPSGPPPVPQTAASAPAPAPIPTSPVAFEPTCDTHRPPMLLPHPVQLSPRNTTHTCSSTDNRTVWLQCRRHPHRCRLPYFNLKGGPCPKTSLHAPFRASMVPATFLRASTRAQLRGTFSSAARITHVSSQASGLPTYAATRAPAPAPAPRFCRVCILRRHDKTTVHRFAGFLLQGAGTNEAQGRRTSMRAAPLMAQDKAAVLYTACRGANSYA